MNDNYDPTDLNLLQQRARTIFARASRMQDLHGQAHATALAQRQPSGSQGNLQPGGDGSMPGQLMEQSAVSAIQGTVVALEAAAQQATRAAQADPVISRLNAMIHGAAIADPGKAANVIDVTGTVIDDAPALPATGANKE